MPEWQLQRVSPAAAQAANEPWPVFVRRQEVTISRVGRYTRVVLTKRIEPAPALRNPQWA